MSKRDRPAMSKQEEDHLMKPFVTPVVKDQEGRRFTRTMRRTDKLQDLMQFYYTMVPTVEDGQGVFLHHGRRPLDFKQTPAAYKMKDGDEIEFFPVIEQRMFVTVHLYDVKARRFTRTMRRTDRIRTLMDFYYAMVPIVPKDEARFVFLGKCIDSRGEETLVDLQIEDGATIDVVHRVPSFLWASSPMR